jgi:hypothetical protein
MEKMDYRIPSQPTRLSPLAFAPYGKNPVILNAHLLHQTNNNVRTYREADTLR